MSTRRGADEQARQPAPAPRRRIGRRGRLRRTIWALGTVGVLGGAGGLGYYWSRRPEPYRPGEDLPEITRRLAADLPDGAPSIDFVDVTAEAGLRGFRTFAGPRSSQLPEDMGPGAAWGDVDGDGDDDLFLVSSGAALDVDPSRRAPCALYENLGDGTFRPLDFPDTRIIGMAAAWGDYTGDGRLDLAVTGYDSLRLFRNGRDGLVRDDAFADREGFWAGASWGDFNNDGSLDLYVCGYVRYAGVDAERARATQQYGTAVPYTLNPSSYPPERNLLFVNAGDGTFREVAEDLGVSNPEGRSLGALWHDLDQDGWLDLYVANDVSDNVLYRNLGGRFAEISHAAWVADYRGAMGLAQGDYDRDGDDDIFVTHWVAQENALYDSLLVDLGERAAAGPAATDPDAPDALRFMDVADTLGLGQIALQSIGWGTEFADFDADGWLDLVVANGSTFETGDEPKRLKPQRSFLFWNRRGAHFHDLARTSPAFSVPRVTRGLAVSDYDLDGDQDILLVHHAEGVQLLRNDTQQDNWLQVRLRGRDAGDPAGPTPGLVDGAVIVAYAGDAALRRAVTGPSYLSQSSRTVHVGLGSAGKVDRLQVRWPGRAVETWTDLHANALWELTEGDPAATLVRSGGGPEPLTDRQRVRRFWDTQRAAIHAMKVDGDLPAAISLFREALDLDPAHEDARYYLANCLAATGDTTGAIGQLERLVERNPRSHRGLKRLGLLKAAAGSSPERLEDAMSLLRRALQINPEETGVLLVMGEIDLILGDLEQAGQRLEWACRTNPRAVGGFFLRGYLAWRRDDADRARALLAEAGAARGEDFKPEDATAEGDVSRRMHSDTTPLSRFWSQWDGAEDPARAFAPLAAFLRGRAPE